MRFVSRIIFNFVAEINSIDMNKIFLTTIFSLILIFIACKSAGGTKTEGNPGEVKQGVVNQMTTDMFKKLVYNYQKNPKEWVFEGDNPCIIDFYADWCRPCKMVAPIMEELAGEYKGKVTFYKVNTDNERELSATFNIRSIPAILYVPKGGKPEMSVGLMSKDTYVQKIQSLLLKVDTLKK